MYMRRGCRTSASPVLGNSHVESTSAASLHVLLYLCLPHLLIAPVLNRRGDEEFVPMTTSRFCILAAFVRFLRSAKRYFFLYGSLSWSGMGGEEGTVWDRLDTR